MDVTAVPLDDDAIRLQVGGGSLSTTLPTTPETTTLRTTNTSSTTTMEPFNMEYGVTRENSLVSTCTTSSSLARHDSLLSTESDGLKFHPTPDNVDHPAYVHDHHLGHHVDGKLGVISLAVIVFYSVSGGPFGVEAAVRSAGNFYALLGFLLLPFLWSLPEALMTAELGAAIPEAAGGVAWVEVAFGKQAGWLCGYLSWMSGATDNAIYPVLFLDYVIAAFGIGDDMNAWTRWFWLALCSSLLAYVNWLGLPTVGRMSIIICVLAMSPFVLLSILGVFSVQPHRWFELQPERFNNGTVADNNDDAIVGVLESPTSWSSFTSSFSHVLWAPFLNNLFWNGNSFDSCASFAADVDNPGHVFPRALNLSVMMVAGCYFVPLLVTLGASTASPVEWVDGYFAKAASEIVGPWLGGWTVFAAGISNIAMFQAELSSDA